MFINPSVIFAVFSGEINNGIKKEVFGKDGTRIWIKDDIKMQNFSNTLVSFIRLVKMQPLLQNVNGSDFSFSLNV